MKVGPEVVLEVPNGLGYGSFSPASGDIYHLDKDTQTTYSEPRDSSQSSESVSSELKDAPRKDLEYGILDKPPVYMCILLGFQVNLKLANLNCIQLCIYSLHSSVA